MLAGSKATRSATGTPRHRTRTLRKDHGSCRSPEPATSIHERTRELGLLRAVGMTRQQLRATIRVEAIIIALFGTVLGLGLGIFFGWAIVRSLAEQGFSEFIIPVQPLAVVATIAALAGVCAAILPARRAARLNVLDAIAS